MQSESVDRSCLVAVAVVAPLDSLVASFERKEFCPEILQALLGMQYCLQKVLKFCILKTYFNLINNITRASIY